MHPADHAALFGGSGQQHNSLHAQADSHVGAEGNEQQHEHSPADSHVGMGGNEPEQHDPSSHTAPLAEHAQAEGATPAGNTETTGGSKPPLHQKLMGMVNPSKLAGYGQTLFKGWGGGS
jgi:hypothetical protein